MIPVEEAVTYFNDCKPKYLRRFSEKTPQGNCIKGWICNKSNKYLGSLLIDELNGEAHNQFVQSMPKIEYLNDNRDIRTVDEFGVVSTVYAYEKLDGSCLILYPILYEENHIIEIVPKTRGRAVADKNFLELFNKCDKSRIWDYYRDFKGVLFFELYGILNQHEILHYDTGIDLKLIGVFEDDKFYKNYDLGFICNVIGFKTPDILFTLGDGEILIPQSKYSWYLRDIPEEERTFLSIQDAVSQIQKFLEYLNKTYMDMYGRIAVEGVVINCSDSMGKQKYIKIKPRDIENKHRSQEGIPRSSIVKECLKYFDEYGSQVKEIYDENPLHHTEYLERMLLEDYAEEYVKKSHKKIERIFMQIWNNKQVPVSIHNICNELLEEYGEQGITHCMRMFAQKYPMKKKDASTVYGVLEIKFKRKGLEL